MLEALRTRVVAMLQPEFPATGNLLPDILYFIPSGRPRYTFRIPFIGSITIGSDIHWTIDNVATTTGTTTVDLGTNLEAAWVEVKAGVSPSTIMKGAEQVAAMLKVYNSQGFLRSLSFMLTRTLGTVYLRLRGPAP